MTLKLRWHMG